MKRVPSILLFLIMLAGLIYLFLENQKLKTPLTPTETSFFVSEGSLNPKDIKPDLIHYEKAKEMVENFRENQYSFITEGLNNRINPKRDTSIERFYDTRITTFSLDSIKKLILLMDELVAAKKIEAPDGAKIGTSDLGIRMYYAAYPGMKTPPDYNSKDGRHTLILVPSYKDPKGVYHDFLMSGKMPGNRPEANSLLPGRRKNDNIRLRMAQAAAAPYTVEGDPEVGMNNGAGCPPPNNAEDN